MDQEQAMVDVAAFYNERARLNPSNPPTRRDVAVFKPAGVTSWLLENLGRKDAS